ncbi:MAG TPA: hypothetical protein VHD56_13015 [Tepidisphaeraceae bacterium]|nr:hypothetical protein [Tepidisphaeraceae bacterium]
MRSALEGVAGTVEDGTLVERYQYTPYGKRTVFVNSGYRLLIGGSYCTETSTMFNGFQVLI